MTIFFFSVSFVSFSNRGVGTGNGCETDWEVSVHALYGKGGSQVADASK